MEHEKEELYIINPREPLLDQFKQEDAELVSVIENKESDCLLCQNELLVDNREKNYLVAKATSRVRKNGVFYRLH